MQKRLQLLKLLQTPTGALPLDPTGGLPSPGPPLLAPSPEKLSIKICITSFDENILAPQSFSQFHLAPQFLNPRTATGYRALEFF